MPGVGWPTLVVNEEIYQYLFSKAILHGNLQITEACFDALQVNDLKAVQWMITVLYDLLREDASCYAIFEGAFSVAFWLAGSCSFGWLVPVALGWLVLSGFLVV